MKGGVGLILLLFLGAVTLVDFSDPPNFVLFLGQFHPLIVHFPIGLLVVAALMEGLSRYDRRFEGLDVATAFVLFAGAVSAVFAAVAGYFLSLPGGYSAGVISWHMWLGIGVAVAGLVAGGLKEAVRRAIFTSPVVDKAYVVVLVSTVGMLVLTGHLGGQLTHGSNYLTRYMPGALKALTGLGSDPLASGTIANVDSAVVYADLVQPILNDRCVVCHGESKTRGDLRLDTPEHIVTGGENGAVLVAGEPEQSELVRRITLPLYHDDRMPPEGEQPLTIEQTELIRWWIKSGASFEQQVAQAREETPPSVQTILARLSRPQGERQTGIYALEVDPPDSSAIVQLNDQGFEIQRVTQDAPFVGAAFVDREAPVDADRLEQLEPLLPNIAWLHLEGMEIEPDALEVIGQMQHLTHLYLQQSSVNDEALARLQELEYLKYLNLYGTGVSDAGIEHLAALKNLESVYLWQTNVTESGADRLKARVKKASVNMGASLVLPDSTLQAQAEVQPDSTTTN